MVSVYEYITVANLEAFSGVDYSARLAKYTDTVLEAQITQGERMVNSHAQKSFTGTIPDNVIYITTDIAAKLMDNIMIEDNIAAMRGKKRHKLIWDAEEYDSMLVNAKKFYAAGYARAKGI